MKILNKETVKSRPPKNLEKSDSYLFQHEVETTFDDVYIKVIKNSVVTKKGFIFEDYKLFKPFYTTGILYRFLVVLYIDLFKCFFSKKISLKDVLFVTTAHSKNFFHWHLDVLPKFELIEKFDNPTVALPSYCANGFYRKTLRLYPNIKFIFIKNCASIHNLNYFPDTAPTGNYRPNLLKLVHNRLVSSLREYKTKSVDTPEKIKIYISRGKAKNRKIIHEEIIINQLRSLGFLILHMEDWSYEEQISYTSRASVLLSLHGAGLTHMLFMPKGSKVIEIRLDGDSLNNCYFSMASGLDHDYFYILAKKRSTRAYMNKSTQKSDFILGENFVKDLEGILDL